MKLLSYSPAFGCCKILWSSSNSWAGKHSETAACHAIVSIREREIGTCYLRSRSSWRSRYVVVCISCDLSESFCLVRNSLARLWPHIITYGWSGVTNRLQKTDRSTGKTAGHSVWKGVPLLCCVGLALKMKWTVNFQAKRWSVLDRTEWSFLIIATISILAVGGLTVYRIVGAARGTIYKDHAETEKESNDERLQDLFFAIALMVNLGTYDTTASCLLLTLLPWLLRHWHAGSFKTSFSFTFDTKVGRACDKMHVFN